MKLVLLDAWNLGADVDLSPLHKLGQAEIFGSTTEAQLAARIADADVIVTNKMKLTGAVLAAARKLKLICVTATGYDSIDTRWCAAHGVGLCNVPGYSTQSVAQLTLAMALYLTTRLGDYRDYVHSGAYTQSGTPNHVSPAWHELSGMTWGVVGGGSIGSRVAQMAEVMGCRVLMHRRQQDPRYETVDLDTLCRESDIISLHVPLNDQTRGMISRERIGMMKPDAVVINTARGAVADEGALAEAIEAGRIGALGVDVYSAEPFEADHPYQRILDRPNVCLTPHMAWGAIEARNRCIAEVAENVAAFCRGEPRNRIV